MSRSLFVVLLVLASSGAARAERGRTKPAAATAAIALTAVSISGSGPALVAKVKRASKANAVFRDRDGAWQIHYALAVPRSLPASEITLKISDVTGDKQPICTRHKIIYSEAVVSRGQFVLTRDEVVSPNAKLLLEIESDGEPVARQTFFIQGAAAGTGPIEFSSDEANADDDDADERPAANSRR
jgi:hypothetical protein